MEQKNYKWQLRKDSKKEVCPNCGQRRFVPYVSAADGVTLAGAQFGRCDREQNCGYACYPSRDISSPNVSIIPEAKQSKPLRFSREYVRAARSALFDYATDIITYQDALLVWGRYKIGATHDGRTIFWQIDINGEVRAGKAIYYQADGHRDKQYHPPVAWLHKIKSYNYAHEGEELQQCFFGEHLLKGNDKPVIIVESEKTAAIMSAFVPSHIWLACGGSQNLKNDDRHKVLEGRRVILCPDNGQYWAWRKIAEKHNYTCVEILERRPLFEGCDILDYFDDANKQLKQKLHEDK